MTNINQGRTE